MARKTGGLLKVAAMLGLAVAAKQLSKKENRDAVKNEYNKVKEDPKSYAQDVQDKLSKQAGEYQERAKSEYDRVKQDPKGYAQNVQEKVNKQAAEYQERAKSEIEKAKEDPKGYAQSAQEKAKSRMNKDESASSDDGSDDSDKVSASQGKSSVSGEHSTKPDRMDAEGQLTDEQMNNEWISEGGIHPQEHLQDDVSHGELNKDEAKVIEGLEDEEDVDVVQDEGEMDGNHNIHVVTDEGLQSKKKNK
ncbi:hypothetical protein GCM10022378_12330 [Salinicoccus jeotgali]|uniref:YtxH domain-containing protein n=1 Tax=Salinicoccus jeotgali TaxID=381634 RepID=A0ABP7EVE3_9STAP